MPYLLQQLIIAATTGCIYALIALGYTLVHGVVRQFNLAHGAVYMIGAFGAAIPLTLLGILGVSFVPALLAAAFCAAVLTAAAYGLLIGRLIYRPLRLATGVAPLIATIGLSIFLAEYIRLLQQSGVLWLRPIIPGGFVFSPASRFPVALTYGHVLIVGVTASFMLAAWRLRAGSRFGREQRACAQDIRMAALSGVNVDRVIALTFVLSAALAGAAGALVTVRYGVIDPYMGFVMGIKGLTAAIVGGIGSAAGAVLGGLLIGALESLWGAYFPGDYTDIVVFSTLILVLVFRPNGLLVRPVIERIPGPGSSHG